MTVLLLPSQTAGNNIVWSAETSQQGFAASAERVTGSLSDSNSKRLSAPPDAANCETTFPATTERWKWSQTAIAETRLCKCDSENQQSIQSNAIKIRICQHRYHHSVDTQRLMAG